MAEPASTGCFSQLLMLIAALVIPFFAAFQSSSTTTIEPLAVIEATAVAAPLMEVVYSPVDPNATPELLQIAAVLMQQRLDAQGVTPSSVEVIDAKTILVKIPQTEDVSTVYNNLGNRGLLEFVDFSGIDVSDGSWDGTYIATSAGVKLAFQEPTLNPLTNQPFVTVLSGSDVVQAEAHESQFGGWEIEIQFSPDGAETLKAFTSTHIGKPMAIVVDSVVISVPLIQAELNTSAVIQSGNYTEADARRLAAQIGIGALPIDLQIDSVFYPG